MPSPRRLQRHTTDGPGPALWGWHRLVPAGKVYWNYLLMGLARSAPTLTSKNGLYRAMGIKVGKRVAVGLEVTMDVFWPELITLGDDCTIGYGTTILCHEFVHRDYATGPVVVGKRATVGANCTILPGVVIADDAIVSAHSLVNRDVSGFVGGVPARPLRRTASADATSSAKARKG